MCDAKEQLRYMAIRRLSIPFINILNENKYLLHDLIIYGVNHNFCLDIVHHISYDSSHYTYIVFIIVPFGLFRQPYHHISVSGFMMDDSGIGFLDSSTSSLVPDVCCFKCSSTDCGVGVCVDNVRKRTRSEAESSYYGSPIVSPSIVSQIFKYYFYLETFQQK